MEKDTFFVPKISYVLVFGLLNIAGQVFFTYIVKKIILQCRCALTLLNVSLSLMTEWRSRVLRVGGAVPCVDPATVILAGDFIKTATRPLGSVAAR